MGAPHTHRGQKGHRHGLSSPRGHRGASRCRQLHARTQIGPTRRIEIRLWHADGRIFLSGRPGKRSWYAKLRANPQLNLHVKSGAEGDLEMTAPPITDTGERREMLSRIASPNDLDAWIEGSPLVELPGV
jgi:hypothetical protein